MDESDVCCLASEAFYGTLCFVSSLTCHLDVDYLVRGAWILEWSLFASVPKPHWSHWMVTLEGNRPLLC